jgi:hypothetical protein
MGASSISNAIKSDPIPFFTNYTAGSLSLNAASLSDSTDSDSGELVSSLYILVRLGTLAAGQNGQVCYRVTIR